MEKDVAEKTIPSTLSCFEKIAITNDTPEGWFYGKVRHALDVSFTDLSSSMYESDLRWGWLGLGPRLDVCST